jgi:hypothetical protein
LTGKQRPELILSGQENQIAADAIEDIVEDLPQQGQIKALPVSRGLHEA